MSFSGALASNFTRDDVVPGVVASDRPRVCCSSQREGKLEHPNPVAAIVRVDSAEDCKLTCF